MLFTQADKGFKSEASDGFTFLSGGSFDLCDAISIT
jgi:hypothetical protein